ncbi:MAG: sodium:dicarboxylate symporter [Proteobacteria bacterium]|nr:MAG: sodium:dicarboxylate symporter [Pseudomonadota bacterium]
MIAVIIAAQRLGLLTGIVAGLALAFTAIVLFGGEMGSYKWLGTFFLHCLKMIIVPLIVFAMITGVAALGDVRKLGRLGGRTMLYYVVTTTVAVVIGALLVNIIQPGEGVPLTLHEQTADKVAAASDAGVGAIILSFVSDNILASMAELQMLPIIVFSLLFGAVVTTLGEVGAPVIALCRGANEAMMKIVHLVMLIAPVGVFGLIAGDLGERLAEAGPDALLTQLESLASYAATVVGGLAIHALVVIPVLLWLTTGRSPLTYARGMAGALLTAFSTASSAATMPMTIEQVRDENGVDDRAAQFVIPLGATVNMDGTALYEAVAAIFIAQAYGIELGLGAQVLIIITATLAAVGAAGIPQAGLVTLVMVLQAVGLPTEGVGLILAVDWLLDRFRTTVNVWGDAVGAAVMERHGLPDEGASAPLEPR